MDLYIGALDDHLNDHGYIVPAWGMPETGFSGRSKRSAKRARYARDRGQRRNETRRLYFLGRVFYGVAKLAGMRSKIPIPRWGPVSSVRTTRFCPWATTVFPWAVRTMNFMGTGGGYADTKYPYVTHSELNAILNFRGGSLAGAKLYVSLFPCNECAKAIIQSGISEVIYDCDKYAGYPVRTGVQADVPGGGSCLPPLWEERPAS